MILYISNNDARAWRKLAHMRYKVFEDLSKVITLEKLYLIRQGTHLEGLDAILVWMWHRSLRIFARLDYQSPRSSANCVINLKR
jgi:hypothetical protein